MIKKNDNHGNANHRLDFDGSVVLITGGGKGVGLGISLRFLESGATVYICGRSAPASLPCATVEGLINTARFIAADVRDIAQSQAMFDQIMEHSGRLDVLVNNAGGAPHSDAASASPRFSSSIVGLNLLAPINLAQMANTVMQPQDNGGTIINIASVSVLRPSPGTAVYGAAKSGLVSFSGSVAVEWAPKVRVNTVIAGLVRTEQSELHYGDEAGIEAVSQTIPLSRMAQPQDIGDACLFLASSLASYVTGSTLTVHGGGEKPAFLSASNANNE